MIFAMGQRGPKPKNPKAGEIPGDGIAVDPPSWMNASKEAEDLYRSLAVALNEIGLVRSFHVHALVTLCESWDRDRDLQKDIIVDGEVLENEEKGTRYLHPALNAQKMAQNEMARQAKILGMEVAQLAALRGSNPPKPPGSGNDPTDANSYLP